MDIFETIQTLGIIIAFALSYVVFKKDLSSRKLSNYISLIQYHRDLWRMTIDNPSLLRVINDIDDDDATLTHSEQMFLTFLFLHITCSYELHKYNQVVKIDQLKMDVSNLLNSTIVQKFWHENRQFYNKDFAKFIDQCFTI